MKRILIVMALLGLALALVGCSVGENPALIDAGSAPETGADKAAAAQFTFDFDGKTTIWTGAFADYPVGQDAFYELESGQSKLPRKLGRQGNKGFYLSGNNHSDDLFMFAKAPLTGLVPGASYAVDFSFDLINDVPEGLFGVGGSPGESVFVKFGIMNFEPLVLADNSVNFDKANQSQSGLDAVVVGNFANPLVDYQQSSFQVKPFSAATSGYQKTVTADADGNLWVVIGTDSGFESTTSAYYDNVVVTLTEVVQ